MTGPPASGPVEPEARSQPVSTQAEFSRLIRVLLALPQLDLRVLWVGEYLTAPSEGTAAVLSLLCEEARRGAPGAQNALLPVALFFARLGSWHSAVEAPLRRELRLYAERNALWSLERLLRVGPPRSASDPAPAQAADPLRKGGRDVSDTQTALVAQGRELTVGERRALARRPTRTQLEKLLRDSHPLVLEQLLACPKLTEADVLRLASRRPPNSVALETLLRSVRWLARPAVRRALILQPSCPPSVSIPFVHTAPRGELRDLARDPALPPVLRTVARELIERAPPLGRPRSRIQ